MTDSPVRRLVILAEGRFGPHDGKTAMGVIRYGQDPVVAVIDSTNAGRNVREWLGDRPRFDIPIVASLADALALGRSRGAPTALLIGIAPTGGKLPGGLAAGDPRLDRGRARHPVRPAYVHRRRPGVRRGRAGGRRRDRRLPPAAQP